MLVGTFNAPFWLARRLGFGGPLAPTKQIGRAVRRLEPGRHERRIFSRWLRAGVALVLLGNLAWIGAAAALSYGWPLLARMGGDAQWEEFERIADRARATALYDSEGRYFGLLSASFERDHLGGLDPEDMAAAQVIPDHKAIPVEDAPPHFWRCLVYLEDRRRNGWDNPYGISFRGVVKIPYQLGWSALRRMVGAGRSLIAGGSTLEMQLARSLWKQYRHNSNALLRKLREWRAAPVLRARLAPNGDERRLRAWLAQHLALIQAAGGEQDVYGVEAAGRLLFGKTANQLDAAEQLLLAAAIRRPLRLRADPDSRRAELARAIGEPGRPGRALRCAEADSLLDGAPVIEDAVLRAVTTEKLTQLATQPFTGPTVDPDLAPFTRKLLEHPAGPRLDPQRLAADLAYGLQIETQALLSDRFAPPEASPSRHPWRGRVIEARLTVDLVKNLALSAKIDTAIEKIEKSGRRSDPPALTPGVLGAPGRRALALPRRLDDPTLWLTPYIREHEERVSVLVVAADLSGRIVRLVSTSYDSVYAGGARTRDDWGGVGNGRYRLDLERRGIGSVGKIGAALLLAEVGVTDLDARWSNRCLTGLSRRCASASGGGPSAATPAEAFARSLNAAVIRKLSSEVSPQRIERFIRSAGMGDGDDARFTPPATRLALGRVVARPMAAQKLMAAAYAYATGDFNARIAEPRLISAARAFDPTGDRAVARPPDLRDDATPLSEIIRPGPDPAASSAFVRKVLSAPICGVHDSVNKPARGTLWRMKAFCAEISPQIRLHLAKTGTVGSAVAGSQFDESDWWIAGVVEFADRRVYTYIAVIGDGPPSTPFARGLGAGAAAPLIDALLQDLSGG